RRKLAQKFVARLRDPFAGYSYSDLNKMTKAKEAELEEYVGKRDFDKAGVVEVELKELEEAKAKVKPMTRGLLEKEILLVQKLLDGAVEQRQFTECGPLQEKLDALVAKRVGLPTILDLEADVTKIEELVLLATSARDYKNAGAHQKELEAAKHTLESARRIEKMISDEERAMNEFVDALEEEIDEKSAVEEVRGNKGGEVSDCGSRAELEIKISTLTKQVDKFVTEKKFKDADEIQLALGELENLRTHFLSCKEMKLKLVETKKSLDSSIASKKFAEAETFQAILDEFEVKYETEKVKEVEFDRESEEVLVVSAAITAPRPVLGVIGNGSSSGGGKKINAFVADKENISVNSGNSSGRKTLVQKPLMKQKKKAKEVVESRPVSKLRPKKPLIKSSEETILEVAKFLSQKRGDAALLTDASGGLAGIITDNDICRRVVAQSLDVGSSVS
ncbi:hypothetical protein ScalyP_jg10911, partial [Parmales sp. scaly parma]